MECGFAITFMFKWIVHKYFEFICYEFSQKHENEFCIIVSDELDNQQGNLCVSIYVVCQNNLIL